jgi:hypothetical protein
MREVVSLLREAGFEITKAYYLTVNDLTYTDAEPEENLRVSSFKDLMRIALKKPTKLNILRLLAYPIVKLGILHIQKPSASIRFKEARAV